jgi:hypothetical protein
MWSYSSHSHAWPRRLAHHHTRGIIARWTAENDDRFVCVCVCVCYSRANRAGHEWPLIIQVTLPSNIATSPHSNSEFPGDRCAQPISGIRLVFASDNTYKRELGCLWCPIKIIFIVRRGTAAPVQPQSHTANGPTRQPVDSQICHWFPFCAGIAWLSGTEHLLLLRNARPFHRFEASSPLNKQKRK